MAVYVGYTLISCPDRTAAYTRSSLVKNLMYSKWDPSETVRETLQKRCKSQNVRFETFLMSSRDQDIVEVIKAEQSTSISHFLAITLSKDGCSISLDCLRSYKNSYGPLEASIHLMKENQVGLLPHWAATNLVQYPFQNISQKYFLCRSISTWKSTQLNSKERIPVGWITKVNHMHWIKPGRILHISVPTSKVTC